MVRIVKYTSDLTKTEAAACGEHTPECEGQAVYHVCFEDGSGVSVCKKCLNARVNEGGWITDGIQKLAS